MSHVALIETEVKPKDLDTLAKECESLGLELVRGQTTFRWYGLWVNDYKAEDAAYRHGIKPEDYGKCSHAIRVKGNPGAYEIGLVENERGNFNFIYDNFRGGLGLEAKAGKNLATLRQNYSSAIAVKSLRRQGYRVNMQTAEDGTVKITGSK